MRIANLTEDSIVDGFGLRLAIFTQGCCHHCPGCHNPQTHDPAGGYEISVSEILQRLDKNPLLDGITLTGGEPFLQPEACCQLAAGAKRRGLSVWLYTGYTLEALQQAADPACLALLDAADVLIDGPFLLQERSLSLPWRGSRNQRVIDMHATRKNGCITLWQQPAYF